MSKQIDNGGAAFPIPFGQVMSEEGKGMTLRDYFAGEALNGLLSTESGYIAESRKIAKWSYSLADEMIKARKGGDQP